MTGMWYWGDLVSVLNVLFGRKRFESVAISVYHEWFCKMGSCLSDKREKTYGLNLVIQLSRRTWVLWALLSHCCWLRSSFLCFFLCWWKCRVWASRQQAPKFCSNALKARLHCSWVHVKRPNSIHLPSFMDPRSPQEWQKQLGASLKRSTLAGIGRTVTL
jgi:hypothetical protein